MFPEVDFTNNKDTFSRAADLVWEQFKADYTFEIPPCFSDTELLPSGNYFHIIGEADLRIPQAYKGLLNSLHKNFLCHIGIGEQPNEKVSLSLVETQYTGHLEIKFEGNTLPFCTIDKNGRLKFPSSLTNLELSFETPETSGIYHFLRLYLLTLLHEITQSPVETADKPQRTTHQIENLTREIPNNPNSLETNLRTILVPRIKPQTRNQGETTIPSDQITAIGKSGRIYQFTVYTRYLPEGFHRSQKKLTK